MQSGNVCQYLHLIAGHLSKVFFFYILAKPRHVKVLMLKCVYIYFTLHEQGWAIFNMIFIMINVY